MKIRWLLHTVIALLLSFPALALEIKGTIELQDDWQPVVYLASLNSPENLFVASPDFIIAETFIQPDGTFKISTTSIPKEERYYRLYLVKGNNASVEFNTSAHRNFIHLLLGPHSAIEIDARVEDNTFFVNQLLGSADNNIILNFDKELAKRKQQFTNDIAKAKRDFLTMDMGNYIRNFVENEKNALVGLYALYHLDQKDTDFLRNSEFYFSFQTKLELQFPNSHYAEEYAELLESLVGFREMVCEMPGVQPKWKDRLLIVQFILIVFLLFLIGWLLVNMNKKKKVQFQNLEQANLIDGLTSKQKEILELLALGKTNKEIAQDLFVELSTVKTHINNIYRQLNVSTRKEASDYYNSFQK